MVSQSHLRLWANGLYSFVLVPSVNGYGATELAMNAVVNAQLWHRWIVHLYKRTLEVMRQRDGDSSLSDFDVCAVGKSPQLAHPKKAKNTDTKAPLQLVFGDLIRSFTPIVHGGYKYVSRITDQFSRWAAVYLLGSKDQALASIHAYVASTVLLSTSRLVWYRTYMGGEYSGKDSGA